jgi:VWFA-related protein
MNRTRAVLAVILLCGVGALAQSGGGLTITFPTPTTILTGAVVLKVTLADDLAARVESLTFYVDGMVVCASVPRTNPQCAWNAGRDVKAHVVRVVATVTGGSRIVATVKSRAIGYTETVRVNVTQLTAVVRDSHGRFVTGLPREAFRVSEAGKPQRVTHFAAHDSPLDLLLAIDVSGSMADSLPDLKEAVTSFLRAVRPIDRVTIVAFNDTMFTLAAEETDVDARVAAVDRLLAFGGTALYDVLSKSVDTLQEGTGRRAIVLFTDGEDRSSQTTLATVREKLESTDATLFVIGLGRGATAAELRKTLEDLVDANGGLVLFAERAKDLKTPFATILDELSHQYLLGYEPTDPTGDGAWRPIKVDMTDKNLRVRVRRGYRLSK